MQTTISLAQVSTHAGQLDLNLHKTEKYIQQAKCEGASIVLFPEMWLTGFSIDSLKAHASLHRQALETLCHLAKNHHIAVCGSFPKVHEGGAISNSSLFINALGHVVSCYDKIHLFSPSWDESLMKAGDALVTLELPWGLCGFAICYDLRFPELFRSYALMGAKAMILTAAFPLAKLDPWITLIKARAIENQLYMICVNRVGYECYKAGPVLLGGNSMMVSPRGEILCLGDRKSVV